MIFNPSLTKPCLTIIIYRNSGNFVEPYLQTTILWIQMYNHQLLEASLPTSIYPIKFTFPSLPRAKSSLPTGSLELK